MCFLLTQVSPTCPLKISPTGPSKSPTCPPDIFPVNSQQTLSSSSNFPREVLPNPSVFPASSRVSATQLFPAKFSIFPANIPKVPHKSQTPHQFIANLPPVPYIICFLSLLETWTKLPFSPPVLLPDTSDHRRPTTIAVTSEQPRLHIPGHRLPSSTAAATIN